MSDDEDESMGPERVRHLRATVAGPLLPTICSLLGLDRAAAATLVNVGAVYIDKVIPKDTYLRVHSHPRRFPIAITTDWASRVVASSPHFVVLNKPGGVPIHRTLDNATETAEIPTHGLVVLARSRSFMLHFHRLLRERVVTKEYAALTFAPPPLGRLVAYMHPSRRCPKVLSPGGADGLHECRLVVLSATPIPVVRLSPRARDVVERARAQGWASPRSGGAAAGGRSPGRDASGGHGEGRKADGGGSSSGSEGAPPDLYEVRVRLETGRTHQIRAQLAYVGCSIVGDAMYHSNYKNSGEPEWSDQEEARRTRIRIMEESGELALQATMIRFRDLPPEGFIPAEPDPKKERKKKRGLPSAEAMGLSPDASEQDVKDALRAGKRPKVESPREPLTTTEQGTLAPYDGEVVVEGLSAAPPFDGSKLRGGSGKELTFELSKCWWSLA